MFFCLFFFIFLFFSSYRTISFVWIVSHLVFYITFASNFQRLLVVYSILHNCPVTAACLSEISGNLKSLFSLLFCYLCLYFRLLHEI